MKMPSAEYAKRLLQGMDTFHLTKETELDRLKCIYTARIGGWTVDDWTRVRTVHLKHHGDGDLVCYVTLNKKKQKKKT